jgi:protoporphyrinogen oxidase
MRELAMADDRRDKAGAKPHVVIAGDSAGDDERIDADAVIIALPAGPASDMLHDARHAGPAVSALAEVPHSSVATVTLAYRAGAFPGGLSGRGYCAYRVPAVEGKAFRTWLNDKEDRTS